MLKTEMRNAATTHIDTLPTAQMVQLLQDANLQAAQAVGEVCAPIAALVDAAAARMAAGGRLIYVGCGTSGRLGVLDASECPPTYGTDPAQVVGLIAGGDAALRCAVEGAEDDADAGRRDLAALAPCAADTVVGISAAGGARYVLGALACAREHGCLVGAITANADSPLAAAADIAVCPDTGPEPITGSTRMKAGTAQKMVLNMLSTGVMIRLGKVLENWMIDLRPTNEKLRARCIHITAELSGLPPQRAQAALEAAGWDIRAAVQALRDGG